MAGGITRGQLKDVVSGEIVGTTGAQTLASKTLTGASIQNPIRSDVKQDTKANLDTYALSAGNGQLCFATDEEAMYQVINNSLESVGGGGIGSVDILFADIFDDTPISKYSTTGTVVITPATAEVLQGKKSLKITHTSGASAKRIIPVSNKFQNRLCKISFDVASNALDGNLTLTIEDETNSSLLLTSESIQPQEATVNSVKRSFTFTIPATCDSLSYLFTAVSESGKLSYIDNVVIELVTQTLIDTEIQIPVITEWEAYTPTFQGLGTPTGVNFKYRRVGDSIEIQGKLTTGTTTGVELQIGLPFSYSIDTGKVDTAKIVGTGYRTANTDANYIALATGGDTFLNMSLMATGTPSIYAPLLGNAAYGSGEAAGVFASIPIAGWTSTEAQTIPLTQAALVQESDSTFKGMGFVGNGSTNTGVIRLSANILNYGDAITYASSITNGDTFTATRAGIYHLHASIDTSSGSPVHYYFTKNASTLTAVSADSHPLSVKCSNTGYANTANDVTQVSGSPYCEVGDIIRFHCSAASATATNSNNYDILTISYQGSLSQINASETDKITIPTSELRFEGASARGGTATAIVKFDTMTKLRGDAFTIVNTAADGTVITMKKAGRLNVSAAIAPSTFGHLCAISKNQTTLTSAAIPMSETIAMNYSHTSTFYVNALAGTVDVVAGDAIRVACGTTLGAEAGRQYFQLNFQEQEVSVSVTNLLPQFSDSDSMIQVNTRGSGAAGYGSVNTAIPRFSNLQSSIGSDITYSDSATLGASFTINADGIYSISYAGVHDSAQGIGISKNSTELTTAIASIATANRLTHEGSTGTGEDMSCSWTGYLQSGDVIRPHDNPSLSVTIRNARNHFTIAKAGKPNITGVDITRFVSSTISVDTEWELGAVTFGGLTFTDVAVWSRRVKDSLQVRGYANTTGDSASTFYITLPVNRSINFNKLNANRDKLGEMACTRSTAQEINTTGNLIAHIFADGVNADRVFGTSNFATNASGNVYAKENASDFVGGDVNISFNFEVPIVGWETDSDCVVYNQLGTENTFSARIANNGAASITSQSSPFIDSVSRPGTGAVLINFKSGFFTVAPSVVASARSGSNVYVTIENAPTTSQTSVQVRNDAGTAVDADIMIYVQRQDTDYKNPNAYAVVTTQQVAYLKEEQAAGTNSHNNATFNSGSFTTRFLNTKTGNDFVTLNSNQFTLPPGSYLIEAHSPIYSGAALSLQRHVIKLRNITDSTDQIIGSAEIAQLGGGNQVVSNRSFLQDYVTITNSKTFEIQHRCAGTQTSGFGVAANLGVPEVYSQVKITKLK